jgi:hypothetical protein
MNQLAPEADAPLPALCASPQIQKSERFLKKLRSLGYAKLTE